MHVKFGQKIPNSLKKCQKTLQQLLYTGTPKIYSALKFQNQNGHCYKEVSRFM